MPEGNRFIFSDVERDTLLLVEGIDDARFFAAFLKWLGKTDAVQIVQVRGKDKFGRFLTGTLKRVDNFTQLRRLGLIRDADTSASSAFKSLCGALADAGLPVPEQAWETQEGELHVSVAILPDMDSGGNLEELCLRSLKSEPELSCIDEYVDCVDCVTSMGPSIADNKLAKTKIYTYLAAGPVPKKGGGQAGESTGRTESGLRIGEAAERGVWNWESPAFGQLKDWLRNLAARS